MSCVNSSLKGAALLICTGLLISAAVDALRTRRSQSVEIMHFFNGHYVVGYSTMSTLRVVCMSQEWPLHDWCAPAETCY